ncbi:MAG: hypothetical protein HOP19_24075 [Acidobacteria bacterium]|nr:hypothetical protein [Acidobacteriota bacterium]
MKRISLFTALALCSALIFSLSLAQAQRAPRITRPVASPATPTPPSNNLPLKRVILYSNGVAYFERRGQVSGKAEINLAFKQSQVDDVLKSLVVLDLGKGRVGAVSYNSSAPPDARLKEIPFSIGAASDPTTGGLAAVLRQFQGARVSLTTANQTVSGSILTLSERQTPAQGNTLTLVKTSTLVLALEGGELRSFDLNDVRSVKLLDDGAKTEIAGFAEATAAARRRDAKTISITSDGEGAREMVVSYTIAAPIWKTTYRVVLDAAGTPFFQGWAIVDNVSEEDWQDVSLSFVSGTPVSFIQPIQQPLYRYRPVVPIPQDLQLTPQTYESGLPMVGVVSETGIRLDEARNNAAERSRLQNLGGVARQQVQINQNLQMNNRNFNSMSALSPGAVAPPAAPSITSAMTSGDSGVEAAAQGEEVGELFEYRVEQPVTVRKDRSALIPILQTKMDGERVSVYNETTRRDRPMNGIRLKNTSALTLEGGSITVLDGDAYAGEALMDRLKAGEQRFISFGLDLGTLVTTKFKSESRPVYLVRARNGVFETHYYQSDVRTYTIINQTDKKRIVYIEHPLRVGWKLSDDTQKPASQTLNFYRFRVELEPRKTVELPVIETQPLNSTYMLSDITPREIEFFFTSRYIDATTRAELEKLVEIKGRIAQAQARISTLDQEVAAIGEDQKRLRENIEALKNTADAKALVARYIAKADQQETRLEQIVREKKIAQDELNRWQAELSAAIKNLSLERKLPN